MPRTPLHPARIAAKIAVSPVSSKRPLQARSTLPHRPKRSASVREALPQGPPFEPRSRTEDSSLPTALPNNGSRTLRLLPIEFRNSPRSRLNRVQWLPLRDYSLVGRQRHTNSCGTLPLRRLRPITVYIPPTGPCRPLHPPRLPSYMHRLLSLLSRPTPTITRFPPLAHAPQLTTRLFPCTFLILSTPWYSSSKRLLNSSPEPPSSASKSCKQP